MAKWNKKFWYRKSYQGSNYLRTKNAPPLTLRSDEGLTLQTSVLESLHRNNLNLINSIDIPIFLRYDLALSWPSLVTCCGIEMKVTSNISFYLCRLRRPKQSRRKDGQKKQAKWLHRQRRNGREDCRKLQTKKRRQTKNWQRFKKRLELSLFVCPAKASTSISLDCNRPFPNYLWPPFQSESWCSSFHMKISIHSHANEN